MNQNKSVEEVVEEFRDAELSVFLQTNPDEAYYRISQTGLLHLVRKLIQQERQTSQEREREIVGKLFEALDYQNTERELNAKEEDRMGIKLALQQFKLKLLTEYNITLTNPNKD